MNRPETSPRTILALAMSVLCSFGSASGMPYIPPEGIIPASVPAAAVEETPFTIKGVDLQEGSTVTLNDGVPVRDVLFVDS